ncbi:hypothetical protein CRG98_018982 [Punica granatum]|uniref:Uncharacterized protein n=1 Tax=Punica granatum TaxID=22663 RepID=A0A2I0JWJ9_PUNGR|nr:hypothetical protein CRG98_018982 [Punica granatum]
MSLIGVGRLPHHLKWAMTLSATPRGVWPRGPMASPESRMVGKPLPDPWVTKKLLATPRRVKPRDSLASHGSSWASSPRQHKKKPKTKKNPRRKGGFKRRLCLVGGSWPVTSLSRGRERVMDGPSRGVDMTCLSRGRKDSPGKP